MQTIGELAESFHLYGVCEPCDRVVQVDVHNLIEKLGADYPMPAVRKKLRCGQCNRLTENLRIVYVGPDGKAAAFRYQR